MSLLHEAILLELNKEKNDKYIEEVSFPKLGINKTTGVLLHYVYFIYLLSKSKMSFMFLSKRYNITGEVIENFMIKLEKSDDVKSACEYLENKLKEAGSYDMFIDDLNSKDINKTFSTRIRNVPQSALIEKSKDVIGKLNDVVDYFLKNNAK